jgi:cyclopropane fatty-acyl-phospholipid synthase-like methyltransferase
MHGIHSIHNIHSNGYWVGLEASSQHVYDHSLGYSLVKFFKNENIRSVVDFGCGMGDYVKTFREYDINATGFDGNPNTPTLTHNLCGVLDLSIPHKFDQPFDWVMSLEVGEHLPVQFEDVFINNLHNNNKHGIILSWAVKGQGGHGHFNEQNNDYIKQKICALGYVNDIDTEMILRKNSTLFWFKNTIMVFRKSSLK